MAGPIRKQANFSGQYWSAAGTAANQTVSSSGALIGFVAGSGTSGDVVVIKDGANQVASLVVPFALYLGVETQTSLIVNAPATATVSLGFN